MAFKMKNKSMAKMVKAAGDSRVAMKMKEAPMKMKKSPMEKELVGKQNNLPPELKAKIEAAPAKMRNRKGAMETEAPLKMKKGEAMKMKEPMKMKKAEDNKSKKRSNPGAKLTPELMEKIKKKDKTGRIKGNENQQLRPKQDPNKLLSPGKMKKASAMKMDKKAARKLAKSDKKIKKGFAAGSKGKDAKMEKKFDKATKKTIKARLAAK